MFGISIFSLLAYHIYLISKNRTTLGKLLNKTGIAKSILGEKFFKGLFGTDFLLYFFILIETFRPAVFGSTGLPDKDGFNLNKLENFRQVFGENVLKAFLPVFSR